MKISLKILAIVFWFYVPVFILSILPVFGFNIPNFFFTEFRGELYQWDFELMFTVIFLVWGIYLWKASKDPRSNLLFIDFTIWATLLHLIAMFVIGIVRPNDLNHMTKDILGLGIPFLFVIYTRFFQK